MAKVDFDFSQRKTLFGEDLGKRVTWTGIYDQHNQLANDQLTRDNAIILVMFADETARKGIGGLKPDGAYCHFPLSAIRQLSGLQPGQSIVVSGTLSNPDFLGQRLGTELTNCELKTGSHVELLTESPQQNKFR